MQKFPKNNKKKEMRKLNYSRFTLIFLKHFQLKLVIPKSIEKKIKRELGPGMNGGGLLGVLL